MRKSGKRIRIERAISPVTSNKKRPFEKLKHLFHSSPYSTGHILLGYSMINPSRLRHCSFPIFLVFHAFTSAAAKEGEGLKLFRESLEPVLK